MNRTQHLNRLQTEEFDLCIIGGGASGAGCALDAALRGLKVALIEKTDFAAETSSRSTKLVHGGVRYLEQAFKNFDFAQLRQVRHGLRERRNVLRNAPHLARPLGLVTPVFSWWEGLYFTIGLKLYDWIAGAGKGRFPRSRWLGRKEALHLMPGLSPDIHSAVLYYDGQLDDARYCLALVQSAARAAAVVANHLAVTGFERDESGLLCACRVEDQLTTGAVFAVRAKRFLNCTGPYADQIRHLANPELMPRIRPSKGVHLVLRQETLGGQHAMLIPKTRDGRMVFAIPFEGHLILGTTDEPYSDLEQEPLLEASEIRFLLETLQPFIAQKIEPRHVTAGFGGIRPLLAPASNNSNPAYAEASAGKQTTKSLLRDHEVEQDLSSGLVSLLGGKWTTYRLMARDAVDVLCQNLGVNVPCQTAQHRLVGAEHGDAGEKENIRVMYGFDADICQHLAAKYGNRASDLSEITLENPVLAERILPNFPFLKAEIVYAAREEMALTLRDFLARRIRLEVLDWEAAKKAAPVVAHYMGIELGWSETFQKTQVENYVALLDNFRRVSV